MKTNIKQKAKNTVLSISLFIQLLVTIFAINASELTPADQHETKVALVTVQGWQESWDNGLANQSRKYISQDMLKVLSFEEIKTAIGNRRTELGEVTSRKLIKTTHHGKVFNFSDGQYIAFLFHSNYTNRTNVRELVRVIKRNKQWLIVSDLVLEEGQSDVGN